jgi:hypothetical protein
MEVLAKLRFREGVQAADRNQGIASWDEHTKKMGVSRRERESTRSWSSMRWAQGGLELL